MIRQGFRRSDSFRPPGRQRAGIARRGARDRRRHRSEATIVLSANAIRRSRAAAAEGEIVEVRDAGPIGSGIEIRCPAENPRSGRRRRRRRNRRCRAPEPPRSWSLPAPPTRRSRPGPPQSRVVAGPAPEAVVAAPPRPGRRRGRRAARRRRRAAGTPRRSADRSAVGRRGAAEDPVRGRGDVRRRCRRQRRSRSPRYASIPLGNMLSGRDAAGVEQRGDEGVRIGLGDVVLDGRRPRQRRGRTSP